MPSSCTLSLLLQQLSLQNKRLAVEINLNIVPRSEYELRELHAGDRVEIVHAIGGVKSNRVNGKTNCPT
ncbi:sulfur carrier protein ThiS [Thioflexithrix psekupsensis]|uniref:Thiamine biosynthesis protein ThiS n=1 Tax=Thioflexithrix psekupsensis TaxID=1570016 RepID=A0A251XBG5_9GAMM|nr:sulfur carrier protein ThiS [Thioflexithrix psekupsensis]OUD15782.1 thiamine biosynthesis protein ThiS [Thioflexithrix psekupsensis]